MKKNQRALVFLVLGMVLAGAAAWFNLSHVRAAPDANAATLQSVAVVVARTNLPVSEPIRALQIRLVQWPKAVVPPGAFTSIDDAVGRVPRRSFHEGEPVLATGLFESGTSAGLSPLIGEKMRAVSVEVDEVIGIAGFVKPGTRVDVVATIKGRGRAIDPYSKVILQDIRVLAVDQTLEEHESGPSETVNVVTLEVTPEDAEKVAFAANQGKLQLALRNPSDKQIVATRTASATALRGRAKKTARPSGQRIEIIKGLKRRSSYF